jgi:hypothetical protein
MTALNVALVSNTRPEIATNYNTVTDLFWTTINSYLFCNRNSHIRYSAWMDEMSYTAGNNEEVCSLLQNYLLHPAYITLNVAVMSNGRPEIATNYNTVTYLS